jgi:hypothetical protein
VQNDFEHCDTPSIHQVMNKDFADLDEIGVAVRYRGSFENRGFVGLFGSLDFMVRPDRLERPTFWFVARRSIQLSYGRILLTILSYHSRENPVSPSLVRVGSTDG